MQSKDISNNTTTSVDINIEIPQLPPTTFEPLKWQDGMSPPLNADNLNRIENALTSLLCGETSHIKSIYDILTSLLTALKDLNDVFNAHDTEFENHVSLCAQKIEEILDRLEQSEIDINGLDTRLTELEELEDQLNNALNLLSERVTNNESRIGDIEELIKQLQSSIKSLEDQIKNIVENLPSIELPENIVTDDDKLILNCGTATTVLHY